MRQVTPLISATATVLSLEIASVQTDSEDAISSSHVNQTL